MSRGAAFAWADGVLAGASGCRFSSAGGRGDAGGVGRGSGVGLACGAGAGGLGGGKISLLSTGAGGFGGADSAFADGFGRAGVTLGGAATAGADGCKDASGGVGLPAL